MSKHKTVCIVIAASLILCLALLWLIAQPTPLRLTFLHGTNDSQIGRMGVFRLENNLNERVNTGGGFYQREHERGVESRLGDYGADLGGVQHVLPGVSNTFRVWMPTNGGPYRLVLYCVPDSKTTPQFLSSLRMRLLGFVSQHSPISQGFIGRWAGTQFTMSQYFQVPPPEQLRTTRRE